MTWTARISTQELEQALDEVLGERAALAAYKAELELCDLRLSLLMLLVHILKMKLAPSSGGLE